MSEKQKPEEGTEFRKDVDCHYVGQKSAPQYERNDGNGLNEETKVTLAERIRTKFAYITDEPDEPVSLIDPLHMKALALVIKRERISVEMLLEEYKEWNIDAKYAKMIIKWMEDIRYISKHELEDGTRRIFVKREQLAQYEEKYGPLD